MFSCGASDGRVAELQGSNGVGYRFAGLLHLGVLRLLVPAVQPLLKAKLSGCHCFAFNDNVSLLSARAGEDRPLAVFWGCRGCRVPLNNQHVGKTKEQ